MKKTLRLLACLLAVICLICSLAGCQELEEMREAHGVFTDDGNIMLNGAEYIKLPYFGEHYTRGEWTSVCITSPDVPVLLSDTFGDISYISGDGVILDYWNSVQSTYYCRKDKYEGISKLVSSGIEYNDYGYSYMDYTGNFYEWKEKYYTLTKEQTEAVQYVRGNVQGVMLEGDDPYYYSDYTVALDLCGNVPYFVSQGFSLHLANGGYYLIETDGGYDYMYPVPSDMNDTFKAIMSAAITAEEKYYDIY